MMCDQDCFHCKYKDCIRNDVSAKERADSRYRDMVFQDEGIVIRSAPTKRRRRRRYA